MVKSMTGFGKGKASFSGGAVTAELKTFNHKYFEVNCKLPEPFQTNEEQIKTILRTKLRRGKIYVWVQYESSRDPCADIVINRKRLKHYLKLLKTIQRECKLHDEITLAQLLNFPDVITCKPHQEDYRKVWTALSRALQKALNALVAMRQKEGAALGRDLAGRIGKIERAVKRIKAYLPLEIKRYKQKIRARVCNGNEKNGSRVDSEVALFAKNCDISEEITRLMAHSKHFKARLRSTQESGKVLDFIAQEMHREINTIGAKSSDYKIAREVIAIKGEVEKIREQVQNIE